MQLAAPVSELFLPRAGRVVRAIAEAMFVPGRPDPLPEERLDALVDGVFAFVAAASWPVRVGLRLALVLLRFAPILLFLHARPLERLSLEERVAVLDRLERTSFAPLCLAFVGWRTIATLVFYEDARELAALGVVTHERRRHLNVVSPRVEGAPASGESQSPLESGVRLSHPSADDTPANGIPALREGKAERGAA